MESEKDISSIKRQLSVLQIFVILITSIFLTFIYAITQVIKIDWYILPLFFQGLQFFIITFLTFNFILFLVSSTEKMRLSFSSLLNQWKEQPSLNKIVLILGVPGTIISLIQILKWIYNFIIYFKS